MLPHSCAIRYEQKYGRDESAAIPRCLMAAKFSSATDPTGEATLAHWISQRQIQDLAFVFREGVFLLLSLDLVLSLSLGSCL